MSKIFYIADWHYGHKNILSLDNRPFASVEKMNEELVKRWNSVVSNEDYVYILGDMFWVRENISIPILDSLNGHKILVKGNHDKLENKEFRNRFERIADYLEIKDNGRNVVLSHYPIPCFKNHFYGWIHLYGHVHGSFEYNMMEHDRFVMTNLYGKKCEMYNVGCMMDWMDYTPRTLDQIIIGKVVYDKKFNSTHDECAFVKEE